MKNESKRKFEVTKEAKWMNYNVDDILYGLLQYFATYNPKETNPNHALYITKQNYTKNKKVFKDLCGISAKALNGHLNYLIKAGLIEEFILKVNNIEYPSYGIVNNKNYPYKIIDSDFLFYLCATKKPDVLKIYFTLLNWYEFKHDYEFTKKEIIEILGYKNPTAAAYEMVDCILVSLGNEGIIDYTKYYDTYVDNQNNVVPTPKMRLTNVVKTLDELAKVQRLRGNEHFAKFTEMLKQQEKNQTV